MENREGALNFSKIAFLERFAKFTEAIKKKYQTLDIVQTWGGGAQRPSQTFFRKRYGHVLRGEGVKGPRPK